MTPKLQYTKDYSLFEVHPHNRDISKTKALELSMRRHGFDAGLPIRCERIGGRVQITHGHHRFHVAKSLDIGVWYIVACSPLPLFESETSCHSWSMRDFVVARARSGEDAPEEVLQYHERTGLPLYICISLLAGESASGCNHGERVKNGTFRVVQNGMADRVESIVSGLKGLGVEFSTTTSFARALCMCLYLDEFADDVFLHKVAAHPGLMEKRRSIDDYLQLLELVYNRQNKEKIPLAFLAKEAARKRSATYHNNA